MAKPKRAFVLSSLVVPAINDTDKAPGKSLFAGGSSTGQAMLQPPGKDEVGSTALCCLPAQSTALQTDMGLWIT